MLSFGQYSSAAVHKITNFFQHRVIKFGTVGLVGTLINLVILYFGKEHLFTGISDPDLRVNVSLALAIGLATIHNFAWNQYWTWGDRRELGTLGIAWQFWRYVLASGIGILLQVLLTKILTMYLHYLLANAVAILCAAVLNYLLNDIWTFNTKRQEISSHSMRSL